MGKVMVHMMVTLGIYARRGQKLLRRCAADPRIRTLLQVLACLVGGFLLSAASLGDQPQPFVPGLICTLSGWTGILLALGGSAGYWLLWGKVGIQGMIWCIGAAAVALGIGHRKEVKTMPFLLPALMAAWVAISGLAVQMIWGDRTPLWIYLLRIPLAAGSVLLSCAVVQRKDPVADWLGWSVAVLALAQIAPVPWLDLGYIAAGALAAAAPFPAAALAGLALDLARITPVPMTAVLCLTWMSRLIPGKKPWLRCFAGVCAGLLVMSFCSRWDLDTLPGLLIGAVAACFFPGKTEVARRRGETGFAQVRLEMAAAVLKSSRQLLAEMGETPVDEQTLVAMAAQRACEDCPDRKRCREMPGFMPTQVLHKPLGDGKELPVACKQMPRLLLQLQRSQEQLRLIRADRERQLEYRAALQQQYGFLAEYLQDLSDSLARRQQLPKLNYTPQIAACTVGQESVNGDRCTWFAGVEGSYYLLLCDGMGVGPEAAAEAKQATQMLRKLLAAGYPAEHALRSLNSLYALRGCAGAVSILLVQMQLDTGKGALYQWGGSPGYLLSDGQVIKIGTAVPPPGLSVTEGRETVERLSLRRGETLVLLSDGAGGEETVHRAWEAADGPPGELAARILAAGPAGEEDDATVAVVRLSPAPGIS